MRNGGGLSQGGGTGGGDKWLNSCHSLKGVQEDFLVRGKQGVNRIEQRT